jgi:hypothetical protein
MPPEMAVFGGFRGVAIRRAAVIVRANSRPDRPACAENKDLSMFITPAFAQGPLFGGAGGELGMIGQLMPFVLIFVIM